MNVRVPMHATIQTTDPPAPVVTSVMRRTISISLFNLINRFDPEEELQVIALILQLLDDHLTGKQPLLSYSDELRQRRINEQRLAPHGAKSTQQNLVPHGTEIPIQ